MSVDWNAIINSLGPDIKIVAGVLCLSLAVRVLGSYRTAAERYERSVRDLKSMIADARHLYSEVRQDLEKLESTTVLAAEQIKNLPAIGQTPINAARAAAAKSVKQMLDRLDKIGQTVEADQIDKTATWLDPARHSDSVAARYLAAALPFSLAAILILQAAGIWACR